MEKLTNCSIILDIESIENISGGNQYYEILVLAKDKIKYKITFDFVWDIRCSIENGYIDRFTKFQREAKENSSVLLIEDSDYLNYFEKQLSGTLPINNVKSYILFDSIDTVIEVLALNEPLLSKL
jgi:hypothetical protein